MQDKHYALYVNLTLSNEKLERMYAGSAKTVLAQCSDGRSIRFPVGILRPFVSHQGVAGEFQIVFTDEHKFVAINRV